MPSLIPAAGTLPWRRRHGTLEVALVHRPRYDDWSWAKGKLDPGEQPSVAAARETLEETGLHVRLGIPLPTSVYTVLDAAGSPATKEVHYWAATVTGGSGELEHEIDEVRWVDVRTANDLLDYVRDREQLLALVRADRERRLRTWPLVLVRHAKSRPRSTWGGDDRERPLDAVGREQADDVARVLAAYGVQRVVSSSSLRCVQTVEPYAAGLGTRVKVKDALSEEAFAAAPAEAVRHMEKALDRAQPVVVCSHGPVLPSLLDVLASRVPADSPCSAVATEHLAAAADSAMRKGEVLVAHLSGSGRAARVIAVERVNT
ncbi:NUDIX hydrolase [Intrasporangium calvum]|uniref:Phosphohistidine phosphatase, SixA n=1 Tax=Intrasporangium calvum (strain ATCC 23552 / DSM 43043 / JCM 3097 / NBRC 12989 / NCIMB 10167 / NRRL B-3866 / 7 KIP) TaxID=710696 RepID=E6SAY6_INTC7|nr:histidine phosphatase family protein [Intrasporangium calvum]ADU49447.1 putative phosphohistidine phosphatase, SixA [Intrasporangium calvum DSM 43043]